MHLIDSGKRKKRWSFGDRVFYVGFLAPAFTLLFVFMFLPILFSVILSFTKWNGGSPAVFNGITNYIQMFINNDYWKSVTNTLVLIVLVLTIKIPLGCLLAFIILKITRGYKFYRSVFFLPAILAPLVIGLLFRLMYDGNFGVINAIMTKVGLGSYIRVWLSDSSVVLYSVSIPQVYQYIGTFFLIFLSAFLTIPSEVLESSRIDGASSVRTFFSIMLPMVKDVVQVCLILGITGAIKDFDHPWVITGGGPGYDSSFLAVYMFREAFVSFKFGYGSAVTVTIILYALAITMILRKVMNLSNDSVYWKARRQLLRRGSAASGHTP